MHNLGWIKKIKNVYNGLPCSCLYMEAFEQQALAKFHANPGFGWDT